MDDLYDMVKDNKAFRKKRAEEFGIASNCRLRSSCTECTEKAA